MSELDQVSPTQPDLKENPAPSASLSNFRHTPTISKLAEALAKASGEFVTPKKTSDNPFYKSSYADMAELIEATRPALSKNGLSVLQFPGRVVKTPDGWNVEMTTMLLHSSGEWMRGESDMPCVKKDAQGVGSAQTYGRRYPYQAILCLAAEDDDGSAAVGKKKPLSEDEQKTYEVEYDQRTQGQQTILPFQQKAIQDAMAANGRTEDDLRTYLELIGHKGEKIDRVFKSEFDGLIKWALGKSGKAAASAILKKPEGKSFEHAWKKIWGTAQRKGIPEEDVKRYYKETFGVEHGAQLTPLQFDEFTKWLDGV